MTIIIVNILVSIRGTFFVVESIIIGRLWILFCLRGPWPWRLVHCSQLTTTAPFPLSHLPHPFFLRAHLPIPTYHIIALLPQPCHIRCHMYTCREKSPISLFRSKSDKVCLFPVGCGGAMILVEGAWKGRRLSTSTPRDVIDHDLCLSLGFAYFGEAGINGWWRIVGKKAGNGMIAQYHIS